MVSSRALKLNRKFQTSCNLQMTLNFEVQWCIWWNTRHNVSTSLLCGLMLLHHSYFIMVKMTKNRTLSVSFCFLHPPSWPSHHIVHSLYVICISIFLFLFVLYPTSTPPPLSLFLYLTASLSHISQPPGVCRRMWCVIGNHLEGIFWDFSVDSSA